MTQASLMLEAVQEEIDMPPSSQQSTQFWLPTQEISTIPLNPTTEEAAPDESLPFTQDLEDDDDVPPEREQELLGVEGEEQDLPAISGDSSDMPPAKKRKPDDVAPLM